MIGAADHALRDALDRAEIAERERDGLRANQHRLAVEHRDMGQQLIYAEKRAADLDRVLRRLLELVPNDHDLSVSESMRFGREFQERVQEAREEVLDDE